MIKEEQRFLQSPVFEGMVSIRSVIYSIDNGISDRRIEKILYDKERVKSHYKEIGYLKAVSGKYGFMVEESNAEKIDSLTTGTSHGGIIAICSDRTIPFPDTVAEKGFYVFLDGIEDPYNFGYAVRSVYAAGADGILLPKRSWMTSAGVVCRSSSGASEKIKLFTGDEAELLDFFKAKGYRIVCAEKENSVSVYESTLIRPIVLCIGGERRGNSRAVKDRADSFVHLEYGRDFSQALSAASAAAVLSFEVYRQNKNSNL